MPNFKYLIPRVIRHFLPESIVIFLLNRRLIIKPGLETLLPEQAVQRYQDNLIKHNLSLQDKRVMVFGYGGNLSIGCLLLEAGASQVLLCEREGFPTHFNQFEILERFPQYLHRESGQWTVNQNFVTIFHRDISELADDKMVTPVDLVLTSSVYEHLQQPQIVTKSLAQLTSPQGSHLHFVDLRDHFFKYPFEMLCYPESVWRAWLNPTSNLNRFRLHDYEVLFNQFFSKTEIIIEEKDTFNFKQNKRRIQKQFLSGNDDQDSVTQICILASNPKVNPAFRNKKR